MAIEAEASSGNRGDLGGGGGGGSHPNIVMTLGQRSAFSRNDGAYGKASHQQCRWGIDPDSDGGGVGTYLGSNGGGVKPSR